MDDDLDYVILFNEELKQKKGTGCCIVMFLLASPVAVGFFAFSKLVT